MNLDELSDALTQTFANATELLADAVLLFEHERWARAYAIAHTAAEELGKIPPYYVTAIRLVLSAEINWKELWANLIRHPAKLGSFFAIDYWRDPVENAANLHYPALEAYRDRLAARTVLQSFRNSGLYADVTDAGTQKPSDVIPKRLPRDMIRFVRTQIVWLEAEYLPFTDERIREHATCPVWKVITDPQFPSDAYCLIQNRSIMRFAHVWAREAGDG